MLVGIFIEEENKETEGTTEWEHATGSYLMIQPQSRETSETVATLKEEPSQLQMTTAESRPQEMKDDKQASKPAAESRPRKRKHNEQT